MISSAILHTDGGSRGNPGPSGIGFVIEVDSGASLEIIAEGGAPIGIATNNQAEYQALIWGLENAAALKVRSLDIYADSELMIRQLTGEYRIKNPSLSPLFAQVQALLAGFDSHRLRHVQRADNAPADLLVNRALDANAFVGRYLVDFSKTSGNLSLMDAETPDGGQDAETPAGESLPFSPGLYTLTIKDHFDAAHALIGYPGECRNLHGHTWDVEVSVSSRTLDTVGLVYDFKALKDILARALADFDHRYLNEVQPFDRMNSTAENLARVVYQRIQDALPAGIQIEEVVVWESPQARLAYRES
ncbi:MAG: 6-carboxytetrahydropterin synthase QueD [Coriobacteriales bacterium]|jgi:queuosine biosynthesis protein QueD|nr:6-carboxytetrahydropterin synthase QueD [Coriobacteriales bacterium]